ncbi:MAG: hypothetical protein NVS4B12_03950 [Ktedonobacteraceae bacterium]
MRELAELLASSLDLTHILQILVKRTTEVCEVGRCAVWLFEETRNLFIPKTYFLSAHDLNLQAITAGDHLWYHSSLALQSPFAQRLTSGNGILVIENLRIYPSMEEFAEKFLVHSIMFVALRREGRIVGMMSLDNLGKAEPFSLEHQQLVRAIGQQAAIAIDNARLYQQAQHESKRAERLIKRAQSIYEVAIAVNSHEELSTVLGIATQHLVNGLEADGGSIVLLDNGALLLASTTSLQSATTLSPPLEDLPHCIETLRDETPRFFTEEQVAGIEKEWYQQLGLTNILIVPLIAGARNGHKRKKKNALLLEEKHCVGFAFVNYKRITRQPSRGHSAFAQDIAAQCALAIEKNQLLTNANQIATLATERANTLDAVLNAMTEGVIVLDQEGQVLVHNQTASRFLDMSLYSKDHLTAFLQHYPIYTQYGQPIAYEDFPLTRALHGEHIRGERFVARRADNSERTLEVNIAPLYDDESHRIGIVSAFRDITEERRVEQRIRGALDIMLNAAEVLAGVTEVKEILHRVLTMILSALTCERGFVHLYDEERQLFTPLLSIGFSEHSDAYWNKEQQYWLAPDISRAREPYASLVAGHTTLIPPEHRTSSYELATDTDTVLVAPLMHNKRLLGVMVVDRTTSQKEMEETQSSASPQSRYARREFTIWDVTVVEGIAQFAGLAIEQARWQLEATIARIKEAEMRESNALKDEFLSITAHEFRSPLTIIQAHSQMMERVMRRIPEMPKRERLQESITAIEEQTHQLTNIVNTFLEVTRLNKGQITLQQERVDLGELLQQEVATYHATTTLHSITYDVESDTQPCYVMGDSARLQQIFGNLLQNAIKYSPHGGPISVLMRHYGGGTRKALLEIRIADKGIGIPKDAQSHLFERFYRAPNVDGGKTKGIGLGLYLVAEFLHLHHGTICVESSGEYGEGSCFIVTLPLLESDGTCVD